MQEMWRSLYYEFIESNHIEGSNGVSKLRWGGVSPSCKLGVEGIWDSAKMSMRSIRLWTRRCSCQCYLQLSGRAIRVGAPADLVDTKYECLPYLKKRHVNCKRISEPLAWVRCVNLASVRLNRKKLLSSAWGRNIVDLQILRMRPGGTCTYVEGL